jgi:hypothetical protein
LCGRYIVVRAVFYAEFDFRIGRNDFAAQWGLYFYETGTLPVSNRAPDVGGIVPIIEKGPCGSATLGISTVPVEPKSKHSTGSVTFAASGCTIAPLFCKRDIVESEKLKTSPPKESVIATHIKSRHFEKLII